MSTPRKVSWLKPSGQKYKALVALEAAGGQAPHAAMVKILAGLYETADAMADVQAELIRAGLLARVVVLTDAGRDAIAPKHGPVKPPAPIKPKPIIQRIKAAPRSTNGIGSTGAGHAWRWVKAK